MALRRLLPAGVLAVLAAGALAEGWPGPSQPVRLAPERDYGPFVFQREDGRIDGLSIEMLELLRPATGLQIEMLAPQPLQQQLDALRERRADLVTSLRATPERAEFAAFTLPYVSVPALVVMRSDARPLSLAQLGGAAVAVGQGYAVEAVVRARHPAVRWQPVSDDVQALRGVAERRFAAAVVDAASLAHVTSAHAVSGLRATGSADFEYTLSYAVRKDWPELRDALDEAIRDLPATRRQALVERWIGTAATMPVQRAPWASRAGWALLGAGLLAAAALGGMALWRRRVGRGG